ncbi:heme ABC transporter ATP-binding protein [Rhodovarius lipocyclicus]|uniref:heme ABC transporter ATP-binding protein n=1 Tax=Rhodovarius lipocyclicus TaxID=268410 RepID=UPI00135C633D|nr:heme ABC transporter ATP-binding protein [Rhodovarius lipocyclicus]
MIELDDLRLVRGGRLVLDIPELRVSAGRVLGILGPNGAGKSTLLAALAGELRPAAGQVRFGGRPIQGWRPPELARHRAVLPQASQLGLPLSVTEVVALGRIPWAGIEDQEQHWDAIAEGLAVASAAHLARRPYGALSGGEQQRVQLARVLAQLHGAPPRETALMLDEPTASLDLPHQHAILAAARCRAMEGAAVMLVLHDVGLAARYCDEVLILGQGRAVAQGPAPLVLTAEAISSAYGMAVRRLPDPEGREVVFVPA